MEQITIKQARRNAGLSVKQLAEAVGTTEEQYKVYEDDLTLMPADVFYLVCKATGYKLGDIIIKPAVKTC